MTATASTIDQPKTLTALKKLLAAKKPTGGTVRVEVEHDIVKKSRDVFPTIPVTVTPDRDLEISIYSGLARFQVSGTGSVRFNCLSRYFGHTVEVEGDVCAHIYAAEGVKVSGTVDGQAEMVLMGSADSRVRVWERDAEGRERLGEGNVRDERR